MENIKIKVIKKAIKDAEKRNIKSMIVKDSNGNYLKIKEIEISDITGMILRLK